MKILNMIVHCHIVGINKEFGDNEQLGFNFVANEVNDADKKRAILLSASGAETYKLLQDLIYP